jgi:hypothetical protein
MLLEELAPHILRKCLSYADTRHKLVVSHTCRQLRSLCTNSPSLWCEIDADGANLHDEQLIELLNTVDCSQLSAIDLSVPSIRTDWTCRAARESRMQWLRADARRNTGYVDPPPIPPVTAEGLKAAAAAEAPESRTTDIMVATVAEKCPHLLRINLNGRAFLAAEAFAMLGRCSELSSIVYRGHSVPARSFAQFPALQEMRIFSAEHRICDADIVAIAASCPLLARVAISEGGPYFLGSRRRITDISIAALARTNLLEIEFSSCQPTITDAALLSLAAACPNIRTAVFKLQEGWVSGCSNFSEFGIIALADGCRQLEKVSFTFMSDAAMLDLVTKCAGLVDIDVSNCRAGITDASLVAVAENLPHLRNFNIHGLYALSAPAIERLKAELPKCTVTDGYGPRN